jgi:hypothetical protein
MPYTIPARINKHGNLVPEIIVDDEFKDVVGGMSVYLNNRGYPAVFGGKPSVLLHRIIWALKYGECPPLLDHYNNNPLDCRLANLRPASRRLNNINSHTRRSHARQDLPMGVTHKPFYIRKNGTKAIYSKPYVSRINGRDKRIDLGYYATPEEAGAVYQAMKFMLMLVESALCQ